jgi:hypothetical protein
MRTLHKERPKGTPSPLKQGQHQLHAHMAIHTPGGQQAPMAVLHACSLPGGPLPQPPATGEHAGCQQQRP